MMNMMEETTDVLQIQQKKDLINEQHRLLVEFTDLQSEFFHLCFILLRRFSNIGLGVDLRIPRLNAEGRYRCRILFRTATHFILKDLIIVLYFDWFNYQMKYNVLCT